MARRNSLCSAVTKMPILRGTALVALLALSCFTLILRASAQKPLPPFVPTTQPAPTGYDNASNGFDQDINADFNADRAKFEDVETIQVEQICRPSTTHPSTAPAANAQSSSAAQQLQRRPKQQQSSSNNVQCIPDMTGGGLGPLYNDRACANCHQNPISGSTSQIHEVRAGFAVPNGLESMQAEFNFLEPAAGSLIHSRATSAVIQEQVPTSTPATQSAVPVQALRLATNILGDGFVDVIPDDDICSYQEQQNQLAMQDGQPCVKGLAVAVPVNVLQNGKIVAVLRIGRFGWKSQNGSLLNFAADAYINEMGITNPLHPQENRSNRRDGTAIDVTNFDTHPEGDPNNPDLEDKPTPNHPFGEDVETFTRFMRATKAPPEGNASAVDSHFNLNRAQVDRGRIIFGFNEDLCVGDFGSVGGRTPFWRVRLTPEHAGIGCVICHREKFVTPPENTKLLTFFSDIPGFNNGSDLPNSAVPAHLASKEIHPYSDFMLHDIGTGDGIVQTQFAQDPPLGADRLLSSPALLKGLNVRATESNYRIAKITREATASKGVIARRLAVARYLVEHGPLDQRTRNKIRTAPLWGLRARPELLHDGSALTVDEAIRRHAGEASMVRDRYLALPDSQKADLLAFLDSLGFGDSPQNAPESGTAPTPR